jgi:hypothetical protein
VFITIISHQSSNPSTTFKFNLNPPTSKMDAPVYKQDMPPHMPQTIRYKRYLPNRGPSGAVIFLSAFAVMGYGWYWVAKSNAERR